MSRDAPPSSDLHRPNPIIGTPISDSLCWDGRQSYGDTCAIRSQEFILQQFTGVDVDEHLLVREAMQHGWYTPGAGTKPADVGNLLELHGVSVNRFADANILDLTRELALGHKVIVAVDSKELWHGNSILEEMLDALGFKGADHAVVVSGIDTSDWPQAYVIVSDPGTGEAVARYPLEQFLDAWRDSDFFMVATRDPAPPHLPEMAHFDYSIGHIPEIAGVTYEHFLSFADRPEAWEHVIHDYAEVHHHIHAHDDLGAGTGHEREVDSVADLGTPDAHHGFSPDVDPNAVPHSDDDSDTPDDQSQSDWS